MSRWLILALLVVAVASCVDVTGSPAFAQGNPIVPPAPQPAPVTVHNEITVEAPPPDPQAIADASVQSSQAILTTVVAPPPLAWANDLLGLPDIWRTTPPELSYNHPAVRDLAGVLLGAALSLLALAIFATGAGYALGQEASFGRIAFAVVASIGNLAWWQIGVTLNNAMTSAIGAQALPSLIRPHLVTTLDPGTAVGTVVLVLVYAVVALLLLFSLLFRLGLIDVLIAVGSLALLCYATPQTEHLANHYTRLSVAVLFGQVLIVLGLRVASVLGDLGTTGALGTLLSIVVLWLVRSLPGMLISGAASGSRQGGILGLAVARLLLRRLR